MKKILTFIILVTMICCSAFSAMGCTGTGKGEISTDENTINVSIYKAGYGDQQWRALFAQFEKIFADEGYKFNIVNSNSTILGPNVLPELQMGAKNKIDMYITGALDVRSIVEASEKNGFEIAHEISHLGDAHPINNEGEEEPETINKKMDSFIKQYIYYDGEYAEYNGYAEYDGNAYFMPYGSSVESLLVNNRVLEAYGLEKPLTTKQLINAFNVIAANPNPGDGLTGVKPTVWAGFNAYQYWNCCEAVWAAQYDGYDEYVQFTSLNGYDDPMDAIEVYQRKGMEYSLTVMDTMLDLDNAPDGTVNMEHGDAQHIFITGKAAFMANATWFQNEMYNDYQQYLGDIEMIRMPIISELGVKLGLDGANGTDEDKCEEVLIEVVKGVDANDTNADIISAVSTECGVTLTDAQVDGVREARSIYYERDINGGIIINNFSDKKEIAELFIRYVASDDAATYMMTFANQMSVYGLSPETEVSSLSGFLQSTVYCRSMEDAKGVNLIYPNESLRNVTGLLPYVDYYDIEHLIAGGTTDGKTIWQNCYTKLQGTWEETLRDSGIIE